MSGLPVFAELDAVSGLWRCSVCAHAGLWTTYARGVSIASDKVACRMRRHCRSRTHDIAMSVMEGSLAKRRRMNCETPRSPADSHCVDSQQQMDHEDLAACFLAACAGGA